MEELLIGLQNHFPTLIEHKYLFLFVGATFESLNTLVLAGFLYSIGAVDFWPIILICLAGEFLNGLMWYSVGYFGGSKTIDKFIKKNERGKKIIESVERYFHKYSGRAILITKLTWSLTIATMIMAGSFKYRFTSMAFYNLIGSIGWLIITFSIGYVFGKGYEAFSYVNNIMFTSLFLILAIALIYFIKFSFRSAFVKSLFARERLINMGEKIKEKLDDLIS